MKSKYHINNDGEPAKCKAKPGNCPFGDDRSHFDSFEAAEEESIKRFEKKYGYLPLERNRRDIGYMTTSSGQRVVSFREASTERDFEIIEERIKELSIRSNPNQSQFIERLLSSKRDDSYFPDDEMTDHYEKDRKARREILDNEFEDGKVVGYYKVNQYMPKYNEPVNQILEIRENGRLTVYNLEGRAITTFIATSSRVESIMIKAGDRPSNDLLESVSKNKAKSRRKGI